MIETKVIMIKDAWDFIHEYHGRPETWVQDYAGDNYYVRTSMPLEIDQVLTITRRNRAKDPQASSATWTIVRGK